MKIQLDMHKRDPHIALYLIVSLKKQLIEYREIIIWVDKPMTPTNVIKKDLQTVFECVMVGAGRGARGYR